MLESLGYQVYHLGEDPRRNFETKWKNCELQDTVPPLDGQKSPKPRSNWNVPVCTLKIQGGKPSSQSQGESDPRNCQQVELIWLNEPLEVAEIHHQPGHGQIPFGEDKHAGKEDVPMNGFQHPLVCHALQERSLGRTTEADAAEDDKPRTSEVRAI